ncbi:MAG: endolytic transglycosylase MltG [Solirubrobacteraceae bacterium]
MADPGERTPEERETARLERARRRAQGVFNEPETAAFVSELDPPERPEAGEAPPAGELPEGREPPEAGELPAETAAIDPSDPLEVDEPPEADEPQDLEPELPSGTRRVSHQDRLVQRPQRQQTVRRRSPGRRGRSRARRVIGRVVALIALLAAAAMAWFLVELFQPFGTSPHGRVTVVVPARSTSDQIGTLLERKRVISSSFFFKLRATLAGERGSLRSGTYHLQLGMSYSAVLNALTKAPPAAPTSELTISEGHTRQYVAKLLRRQGIHGSYLAATRHSRLLDPHKYGAPRHVSSLEGFLFPDTFKLVDPIRVSKLVADQLRDFKARFAKVDLRYAHSKHLTAYDVLNIASLIEGEAARPHDLPLVASVIYNRLADGMPLGLDSTTRYATGNFNRPLTESQLHDPSPYNTRVHTGLPPTPINSPGMASIQAAAHPAKSSYLYFFAKPCSNQTVFASSYAQFQHMLAADYRPHCPKK